MMSHASDNSTKKGLTDERNEVNKQVMERKQGDLGIHVKPGQRSCLEMSESLNI